ncbi:MAG: membrane integrity-associated transporter subunit PqiC [Burkholderiales bacterium]|nr:membrane integrity-associated transporter subunit PqiC [Burkholderiales bacterium]
MMTISIARVVRLIGAGVLVVATAACSTLRPAATPNPSFYALQGAPAAARPDAAAGPPAPSTAPTLIVNPPHAAAGFDSPRIMYVREAHKLEYFAHSEWVDTPARMLAPLLVAANESTGAFRAVVLTPSAATGDLRLDTEIVRLQQEFGSPPSRVQFTLRAYLVEDKTRRVLAWREFEAAVPAPSDDPYGGVVAANRAVQTVLKDLAAFCAGAARGWRNE